MKKNLFFLLAAAAVAGCSGNEETPPIDDGRVPIELTAGVNAITRGDGVISTGTAMNNIGIAGWEANLDQADQVSQVDFTKQATWHSHLSVAASTTAHNVSWSTQQFYNADESIYTYMKAWYPCGDFETNPIKDHKYVNFINTDGSVDVMMAEIVYGSKASKVNKPIRFIHKTSQIKFTVKAGEGLAAGTTIEKIVIKDVELPKGFDISKSYSDTEAIRYNEMTDLNIPHLTGSQVIGNEAPAGDPVMIRPKGTNTFKIDVTTNKATYKDVTVTLSGGTSMQAGYAYTVTLTFGQAGLNLEASVDEWQSSSGTAEIQ